MANLITQQEVIDIAFNDKNIDEFKIKDADIEAAQLKYLKPALCGLYDAVLSKKYPALVNDYLKKPLAYFTKYVTLPDIQLQISNAGLQLLEQHYSKQGTDRNRQEQRNQALESGEILLLEAINYLNKNSSSFPEYQPRKAEKKVIGGIIF